MISKLKEHCATIGRNPKEIRYSILVSCVVGNDDKIINDTLNQRKKRVHGMQQVREAENASLVGLHENIISGLNKYVDIGITHFIMDFVGLNENTIKLFDSKVIKKL